MSEVASAPLPVHLLAPYVAAGARDVIHNETMRPRWAAVVAEAIELLEAESAQLAIEPGGGREHSHFRSSLLGGDGSDLALASLVLDETGGQLKTKSPQDQSDEARARLSRVIADLEALQRGDVDAAKRVDELFDAIVERILGDRENEL